jgi:hypothetical protein
MAASRPNIVFVMADDHAAHAIGCYGSRINHTPSIDRLAAEGMRFTNCFCTNSLCSPSRAAFLTGTYNHVNGVLTLSTPFDARQPGFRGCSRRPATRRRWWASGTWATAASTTHAGSTTGASSPTRAPTTTRRCSSGAGRSGSGGTRPTWSPTCRSAGSSGATPAAVLPAGPPQGPHRPWLPDDRHAGLYQADRIPEPPTFGDDYRDRSAAAARRACGSPTTWASRT